MLGEKQEGCIKLTEKSERTKSFCYLKQELLQDVPIFTSCPQLLLINSRPPSMEKSWKKWIQVAPIKDTCHCHAANQCLHGWQWRHHHVSIIPLKMGGDKKIHNADRIEWRTQWDWAWSHQPRMQLRGDKTDPFQSGSDMAAFLHMPFASSQAGSWHNTQTPKSTTCKTSWNSLFRRVSVSSWNHHHHRKSSDLWWNPTGLKD